MDRRLQSLSVQSNNIFVYIIRNCLEFVYECFYRGNKGRRILHGNYVVCFEWDEKDSMIIVKTVFKKQKKKESV